MYYSHLLITSTFQSMVRLPAKIFIIQSSVWKLIRIQPIPYRNDIKMFLVKHQLDIILKKLNINELIESNEKIFTQMVIKNLKINKEYEFAIDCTNNHYYGEIDISNDKYVIRGQTKKSTNSFYSYILLYIINKNERFTISVLPVEKGRSKVEYLEYFINQIKKLDFGIKIICLD